MLFKKVPSVKILTFLVVVSLYVFLISLTRCPPYSPLQIPSVSQLMEALRVKMKERKVLTEELATLATAVSEKAWLPGLRLGKLSSTSFFPPPPLSSWSTVPALWKLGWAKLSQGSRTNICEKSTVNSLWTIGSMHRPSFVVRALNICFRAQYTLSIRRSPFTVQVTSVPPPFSAQTWGEQENAYTEVKLLGREGP